MKNSHWLLVLKHNKGLFLIIVLISLLIPEKISAQNSLDPISYCYNNLMYRPSFPNAPELGSTRTDISLKLVELLCNSIQTREQSQNIVNCMNNLLYSGKIPLIGSFNYYRTEITPENAANSCKFGKNQSPNQITLNTSKIPPELINDYLNNADLKYQNQDYQKALIDYSMIIEIEPQNIRAYNGRAAVKYQLQDYQGALSDYSKAIQLDPKSVYGYYGRGYLLQVLQDYQGAMEDYTKVIEIDAKFALAYRNRGLCYASLNNKKNALFDLKKAAQIFQKQDNLPEYEAIQQLINNL